MPFPCHLLCEDLCGAHMRSGATACGGGAWSTGWRRQGCRGGRLAGRGCGLRLAPARAATQRRAQSRFGLWCAGSDTGRTPPPSRKPLASSAKPTRRRRTTCRGRKWGGTAPSFPSDPRLLRAALLPPRWSAYPPCSPRCSPPPLAAASSCSSLPPQLASRAPHPALGRRVASPACATSDARRQRLASS